MLEEDRDEIRKIVIETLIDLGFMQPYTVSAYAVGVPETEEEETVMIRGNKISLKKFDDWKTRSKLEREDQKVKFKIIKEIRWEYDMSLPMALGVYNEIKEM